MDERIMTTANSNDSAFQASSPDTMKSPPPPSQPQINNDGKIPAVSPTATLNSNEEDSTATVVPAATPGSGVKRVVSSSDSGPSHKKSRRDDTAETTTATAQKKTTTSNNTTTTASTECVDLAITFGFQPGDRIEVEWDVEDEEAVSTRWWGSTLLPYDGRVCSDDEGNVAIRTLRYDAYPEGGFEEPSDEDVIFISSNLLADPETRTLLNYRRAGSEEEVVVQADRSSVEGVVNAVLQAALAKQNAAWNTMTPAQQADIASKIAARKQKLVELLLQRTDGPVDLQVMNQILAQIMAE
mmetsp:Transcript_12455/g.28084  ORF Transcript_12455/g.28084 Transcript_12455/m.28084 type:complete len:298 (+) Transcript_12455:75-968(+)